MPEPTWKYLKSGVALAGKRRIKQLAKAPMAEMPPMFVTAGEWEVMADSIVNWAHKASADGGKVELKVRPSQCPLPAHVLLRDPVN
jgi:acetyl esterase/lipase